MVFIEAAPAMERPFYLGEKLQRHCLLQPLYHFIRGRADKGIFERDIEYLVKVGVVGMRILAAGLGPYFVNAAIVIGTQKRTRQLFEHKIAVFVHIKVSLYKLTGFDAQMLGNTVHIALGEERASGFAAIGAVEAIGFGKHGIMDIGHRTVQVYRLTALYFVEIKLRFRLAALGQRFKVFESQIHE